jgi:hypothetical protein
MAVILAFGLSRTGHFFRFGHHPFVDGNNVFQEFVRKFMFFKGGHHGVMGHAVEKLLALAASLRMVFKMGDHVFAGGAIFFKTSRRPVSPRSTSSLIFPTALWNSW